MGGCKKPGPTCSTTGPPLDDGTTNRQTTQPSKPLGTYSLALDSAKADRNSPDSNRSFLPIVDPYRGDQITPKGAFRACEIDEATGTLSTRWLIPKANQNFGAFATGFELEWIEIAGAAKPNPNLTPWVKKVKAYTNLLDASQFKVIGYVGKIKGDNLFVPRGLKRGIGDPRTLLKKGIPVFVGYAPIKWAGKKGGEPLLWESIGIGEILYTALLRIDGRVVQFLKSEAGGFLEPEFGPILFIGSVLAPLGTAAIRSLVSSVFRGGDTAAADMVLEGMTDEIAKTATAAADKQLTFVEIGAGDLKAAIALAKKGGARVIAVDPVSPPDLAVKELEELGGQFVKGQATSLPAGSADHVLQYFPWRIGGTGSHISGGTWRLIDDSVRLLKPGGVGQFVTEDAATAEFLAKEASSKGLRVSLFDSTAGSAARGASGSGVPNFSGSSKVFGVNIYK